MRLLHHDHCAESTELHRATVVQCLVLHDIIAVLLRLAWSLMHWFHEGNARFGPAFGSAVMGVT